MYKIAVIGDLDSIYGFAALGIDIFPVDEEKDAAKKLHHLVLNKYSIIYITENIWPMLKKEIDVYSLNAIPAIVPIPGVVSNVSIGIDNLKEYVKQAVGSDIIFGEEQVELDK